MKRSIFTVQWHPESKRWHVLAGSTVCDTHDTQREAIHYTAHRCNLLFMHGINSQLRVRRKNGSWLPERTYPDVTPRRKG